MADRYVIERDVEYKGYRCVVAFMNTGHRCGYVALPFTHSLYGKSYGQIYDIKHIVCHGGLTYAEKGNKKHPYPVETKDTMWWIGFDCAHYGDGFDFETAKRVWTEKSFVGLDCFESCHIWDANEVLKECFYIVDQIEE